MSPDWRWAYTLYDTPDREDPPFIHALDTARGTAVCVDLDPLADHRGIWRLDLAPSADGSSLALLDRGEPVADVGLTSFEVTDAAVAGGGNAVGVSGALPWLAIGLEIALCGGPASPCGDARRLRSIRLSSSGSCAKAATRST